MTGIEAAEERAIVTESFYEAYINSDAWRSSPARLDALRRDDYRCRGCNAADDLDVHHRTYERLGRERPEILYLSANF
jgi:hypothetical protein